MKSLNSLPVSTCLLVSVNMQLLLTHIYIYRHKLLGWLVSAQPFNSSLDLRWLCAPLGRGRAEAETELQRLQTLIRELEPPEEPD